MRPLIIRRFLGIIPTIILLLACTFLLTRIMPGDPVYYYWSGGQTTTHDPNRQLNTTDYQAMAEKLGLDLPVFYCSVMPGQTQSEYFELPFQTRSLAKSMLRQGISWTYVMRYLDIRAEMQSISQPDSISISSKLAWNQLFSSQYTPTDIEQACLTLDNASDIPLAMQEKVQRLLHIQTNLQTETRTARDLLPKLFWHGTQNQFHRWIRSAVSFQFGTSLEDGQPAWTKISRALGLTLAINLLSLIISFSISIPLGVHLGWHGGLTDKFTTTLLDAIFAIPVFWLTTVLVIFFTTDEYGTWTNLLPATGIWDATGQESLLEVLRRNYQLLVIPVLVLSTSMLAYFTRQIRNSVIAEKQKTYVWQARARGISDLNILWRHVFRNASFPLITISAYILPMAVAGSLVVEVICNIPGMGRLMFESIFIRDWPVVMGVVMITGMLTSLGMLLSDLWYMWVDPRVHV